MDKSAFEKLLQPGRIGSMTTRNKMKLAAVTPLYSPVDGSVTDRLIAFFAERARGGAGMVTIGGPFVHPCGIFESGATAAFDDDAIPGLRRLAEAIKLEGARAGFQLLHYGRCARPGQGLQPMDASAVPPMTPTFVQSREMTKKDIEEQKQAHIEVARRGKEAGFDYVEVVAGVGALISGFLSPLTNRRADQYGGTLENRARFLLEIIEGVRSQVGPDYPIICRINVEELMEGGNTPDELRKVALMAEESGIDAFSCGIGWHESSKPSLVMEVPQGHWLFLARAMKKAVRVPVMIAYRLHSPYIAEEAIEGGAIDFWEMCRPLIADPELPNKVSEGRPEDIVSCISCNYCFSRVFSSQPLTCTVNPRAGRENNEEYLIVPAIKKEKVIIVGGGPGGMEAARVAALRGHEVTLYESEPYLGGQLELSTRTPHREPVKDLIKYYAVQMQKLKVNVLLGQNATATQLLATKPDVVVLATGATPEVPDLQALNNNELITAHDILADKAWVGQKVLIWGGRQIGVQTAEFLATRGKDVLMVEEKGVGRDIVKLDRHHYMRRIKKLGVRIFTGWTVKKASPGEVVIADENGAEQTLLIDTLIIAKSLKSNNSLRGELENHVEELYLVGDCVVPRKAANAIHDGFRVAVQI